MEWFFFLDDADRELVDEHRGAHSRLGFAVQLVTVRHVGRFLPDPLDVPTPVVDYLAAQLAIDHASSVKRYLERRNTRYEHQEEFARVYGHRDYGAAEAEFLRWLDDQAWTTGDGPKALFYVAVAVRRAARDREARLRGLVDDQGRPTAAPGPDEQARHADGVRAQLRAARSIPR